MADPAKASPALPDTAPEEYGRADSVLFQAWLVLFLLVVCFALLNYLLTYLPR